MWVLVLRNTTTGKSYIWQNQNFKGITRAFKIFLLRTKAKNLGTWTEEAEEFLWENYKRESASKLAVPLSKLLGRTITKNSVISHYHKMKRSREVHDILSRETAQSRNGLE